MRKALTALALAITIAFGFVTPASASNAYTKNSCTSESYIRIVRDGNWSSLHPCGTTGASTDAVAVPSGVEVYHYYNGKYVGRYGPGTYLTVGGVYLHIFYAYKL